MIFSMIRLGKKKVVISLKTENFELQFVDRHFVTRPLRVISNPSFLADTDNHRFFVYYSPNTSRAEVLRLTLTRGGVLVKAFQNDTLAVEIYFIP